MLEQNGVRILTNCELVTQSVSISYDHKGLYPMLFLNLMSEFHSVSNKHVRITWMENIPCQNHNNGKQPMSESAAFFNLTCRKGYKIDWGIMLID